jgi:biopolymer transport protein ExbD
MRLPQEPENPAQINIVPMIDVIFAILTFFIMSTLSLTKQQGLPVNLPSAETSQQQQQQPNQVVVTIDRTGSIALDKTPIQLDALDAMLRSRVTPQQPILVVINADKAASHGAVVTVMDRLRAIDGVRMAIATTRN